MVASHPPRGTQHAPLAPHLHPLLLITPPRGVGHASQRFYYVFGFLAVVLLILVITCSEISVVLCYFQLCNEDYQWWWRSFLTAGSSGLYLFLYSIVYMSTKLHFTRGVSILLYLGYMLIASYSFFMVTGTIGFLSCLVFVKVIYGAVKVE